MSEETFKEELKGCNSCLCWLKHCIAECCNTYTFPTKISNPAGFKKGEVYMFKTKPMLEDMKTYLKYHGVKIMRDNKLRLTLGDFTYVDGTMRIYSRCNKLRHDNLCSLHGTDRKPNICSAFNEETKDEDRFFITDNCLYKLKKVIE